MEADEIEEENDNYGIFSLTKPQEDPYVVDIVIGEESLKMEIDTGAAMSIINDNTYVMLKQSDPSLELKESKVRRDTYTEEQVDVLGHVEMPVNYENQEAVLPLLVIKGNGPNLIGRNWLQQIRINWKNLLQLKEDRSTADKIDKNYEEVFQEELGTFSGPKAKIHVAEDAQPMYFKARPVPYALKEKIENE